MAGQMKRRSYGEPNVAHIGAWFERDEDGPFWALNLMKYRDQALDEDGREQGRSGLEADNEYAPFEQINAVGGRIVLVASVEQQLRGDAIVWDRIAVVLYPTRRSFVEMSMREDFQKRLEHKKAGMETTIVVESLPRQGDPMPAEVGSAVGTGDRLLLQIVTDPTAPDLTDTIEANRLGRFVIEGNIIGNERQWAEARWDRISPEVAEALMKIEPVTDDAAYAVVLNPQWDTLAESILTPLP